MTKQLYQNNAATTIASSVGASDTTIQVANGAVLPAPSGTDFFLATLVKTGGVEIVRCTARVGNTLTVQRAQEGTVANTFAANDLIEMRITAGTLDVVRQEILDARGDRMNLNNRITAIANFASPNGAEAFVGQYYDNNFHASAAGTFTCAANRINAVPFISSQRLRIDRLGIGVTGAHASLARLLIYSSDPDTFLLNEPLYTGPLELDCTTTGFKEHTLDFTFDSGRQYWLAVNTAGSPTIRGISVNTAVNFGLTTADATTYRVVISRLSVNPSDPPPNPFNPVVADVVNLGIAIPSIRMRVAAL